MADKVEVTERGEIVARCIEGAAWTEPHLADHVWLHVEDEASAWIVASALLSREDMAAWCRRVLREVDPDPVPTVNEAAIRADERAKVEAEVARRLNDAARMADIKGLHNSATHLRDAAKAVELGEFRSTP